MKVVHQWRLLQTRRPLTANTVLTAAANVVIAAFGMVTGILAARLLGPQGRGELAAIQTTPGFVATLAMLGLTDALTFYAAQDPAGANRCLGTASAVALVASAPFVLAGYVAMPILLHAQHPAIVSAARCYLLIAPIWALQGMLPPLIRGVGDFAAWNLMRLMVPICAVTVLIVAWLLPEATARFVAFGTLGFNVLLFAPFFWLARQRIKGVYLPQLSRVRPMLRYGLPCALTGLPQVLNLRLDQMLMAAMVTPHELGLYVVAVAWSAAASPLLTCIGAAILPSVASAGSREAAIARLGQGARITGLMALSVCAALIAVTPTAIKFLFGSNYCAAVPAAVVLVPAAGVLGINLTLQEGIRGLGCPYSVLMAELFGLVMTAVSLALMLRPFGILGAAVSSLLGYSAVMAALLASASRLTGLSSRELLTPSANEFLTGLHWMGAMAKRLVIA